MKTTRITIIALFAAVLAAPALAQPGPGMGGGMGPGGGRGFAFDKDNTAGWSLMTPEERKAHREKMLAAKSFEECKAIQEEHHKAMEARAAESGKKLPAPRHSGCERMQARGLFK